MTIIKNIGLCLSLLFIYGCEREEDNQPSLELQAFGLADQCYHISNAHNQPLVDTGNGRFNLAFNDNHNALNILITATDLGTYLIYLDDSRRYLSAGSKISHGVYTGSYNLSYPQFLQSEVSLAVSEDNFRLSEGEWIIEHSSADGVLLYNLVTKKWLSQSEGGQLGLAHKDHALPVTLSIIEPENCSNFPESSTNSTVVHSELISTWPNGDLWGIADSHEHMSAGLAEYDGGTHGYAFHKLGIEHALHDCEKVHGNNGSRNIMAQINEQDITEQKTAELFSRLLLGAPYYQTQGYPEFSDWPSPELINHQGLYYKWIERAYLGGLRLMTEYVTTSEVMCQGLKVVAPVATSNRSCNEMEAVDRVLDRTRHMQRYIDAKNGGTGKGWFRIVETPEQAREVIASGKLAVILGLEIESPFNCFSIHNNAKPECDLVSLKSDLDKYYELGIRAIFPSHKLENAFATGDGSTGFLEIFDRADSGRWRDYVSCSSLGELPPAHFEGGSESLLTTDRQSYQTYEGVYSLIASLQPIPFVTPLHNWLNSFIDIGVNSRPPYPQPDDESGHCQRDGISEFGITFMKMLMQKGMIIDASHFATQGLADAYQLFEAYDYAPIQSHGNNYQGKLLELGGIQRGSFYGNCQRSNTGGHTLFDATDSESYLNVYQAVSQQPSAYQAIALGFDFNGLAPYARPRFGDWSQCQESQTTPVIYPFNSYTGDVSFDKLTTGNRTFDINTDGLLHIGLLPDVIQDLRNNNVSKQQLDPLFRGAEGYVRMWEQNMNRSIDIH